MRLSLGLGEVCFEGGDLGGDGGHRGLHTLLSEPWRRLKVRSRGRPARKAAPYSG